MPSAQYKLWAEIAPVLSTGFNRQAESLIQRALKSAKADVSVRAKVDKATLSSFKAAGTKAGRSMGEAAGKGMHSSLIESMKNTGKVAGVALAGGIAFGLKKTIGAASDLNETISKTQQVFGKSSDEILAWSKTSSTAMGISQKDALDSASAFGNFFVQVGVTRKESIKMSKQFVQMSSDFASFANADPADVMAAFKSATVGEYDALQKYIPTVSAATVEQEALKETHKKSAKELTAAEKATALYNIALKGQGKAAGDFKRTSGGLANQQRILKAQFENVAAAIGKVFLPVATKVVTWLNEKFIPGIQKFWKTHAPAFKKAWTDYIATPISNFIKNNKGKFEGFLQNVVDKIKNFDVDKFKQLVKNAVALIVAYQGIKIATQHPFMLLLTAFAAKYPKETQDIIGGISDTLAKVVQFAEDHPTGIKVLVGLLAAFKGLQAIRGIKIPGAIKLLIKKDLADKVTLQPVSLNGEMQGLTFANPLYVTFGVPSKVKVPVNVSGGSLSKLGGIANIVKVALTGASIASLASAFGIKAKPKPKKADPPYRRQLPQDLPGYKKTPKEMPKTENPWDYYYKNPQTVGPTYGNQAGRDEAKRLHEEYMKKPYWWRLLHPEKPGAQPDNTSKGPPIDVPKRPVPGDPGRGTVTGAVVGAVVAALGGLTVAIAGGGTAAGLGSEALVTAIRGASSAAKVGAHAAVDMTNSFSKTTGVVKTTSGALFGLGTTTKTTADRQAGLVGTTGKAVSALSGLSGTAGNTSDALLDVKTRASLADGAVSGMSAKMRTATGNAKGLDTAGTNAASALHSLTGNTSSASTATSRLNGLTSASNGLLATAKKKTDLTAGSVGVYTSKVKAVPKVAPTTVKTPGLDTANTKFRDLAVKLDHVVGSKSINVGVNGFTAAQAKLASLERAQTALEKINAHAAGGYISGPGGPTSDKVPAMLSNGEYVIRAKAVKALGLNTLNKMNLADKFANGGEVGDVKWPFSANVKGLSVPKLDSLGSLGAGAIGGMGWRAQVAALAKAGFFFHPSLGQTTGGGHAPGSWHYKGRAVDLSPPSMRVFNWLVSHFGKTSKEIIYGPAGGNSIKNGHRHNYGPALNAQHMNHIHWAYKNGGLVNAGLYDTGGILKSGHAAVNLSGKPERVLNPKQTKAYEGGGDVYVGGDTNIAFGDIRSDVEMALAISRIDRLSRGAGF